jgi:signal transduction histidine kinase
MATEVQAKEEDLREELAAVLAQEDIDYDRVVELSNELAKQDPDNVRFSTDAAIISRLGQELVSKQETAVSELIKNAYDADATKADLIFYDANEPGGTLEILDDGNGMTREQLISGFMRISSLDKVENPISPRYNRSRAGKKGIGRFAAQRLGQELEIRTQTRDADYALRVLIDWSEFVGGKDLSSIASEVDEVPKKQEHGTTLTIRNLREAWTEETIKRLYRYTSEITQPFPLSEQYNEDGRDPGFKTRLYREERGDLELVADEDTEIYEHSLARIRGKVDKEGRAIWSLRSDRLDYEEQNLIIGPKDNGSRFEELSNINFEVHYFIYKKDLIPHGYLTTLRDLGRSKGGVRVYRNGFRVLPYGEKWDDWLRLDEQYAKRSSIAKLAPIGTNNFFGFVEIKDSDNGDFIEKSSREGLLENKPFRELRSCVHRILVEAVRKIKEARKRNQEEKKRDKGEGSEDSTERLKSARDEISDIFSEEEDKNQESNSTGNTERQERFEEAESKLQQAVDEIVEEVGMLRVLASLGLSIGEFTHEIKNSIGDVTADASFLADVLDGNTMEGERAERLHRSLKGFDAYSGYFDQAVKQNVTRELEIQPLDRVARRFVKRAREGAEKYGIEFHDPEINGIDLYTCEMHPSEWPAILFNFYTNARKAIDRADSQRGRIFIRVGREEGCVYLEFQDNGVGIPEENEERIFDAFFTTMPPKGVDAPEEEVLQGSGLGLKIVNGIVSSYQGDVFVAEPDSEFATCLRVELPPASDEQIEEYEERYG